MSLTITALLISRLFWEPYVIPSGSMKPTLLVNDYIAVVPTNQDFERGDILVVRHPNRSLNFVMRLVGLPGERIQIVDGSIIIDGEPILREASTEFVEVMKAQGQLGLRPQCTNDPVGFGQECIKMRFTETLPNGISYEVLDIGERSTDFTGVFEVPKEAYFFLGDNRDNSNDSRNPIVNGGLGFVPESAIVGKVVRVVLPNWSERRWWITALTDQRFLERVN